MNEHMEVAALLLFGLLVIIGMSLLAEWGQML